MPRPDRELLRGDGTSLMTSRLWRVSATRRIAHFAPRSRCFERSRRTAACTSSRRVSASTMASNAWSVRDAIRAAQITGIGTGTSVRQRIKVWSRAANSASNETCACRGSGTQGVDPHAEVAAETAATRAMSPMSIWVRAPRSSDLECARRRRSRRPGGRSCPAAILATRFPARSVGAGRQTSSRALGQCVPV